MKQYKNILDKSGKKFVCPNCQKRTFVKFVESETNNYVGDGFGRCDRETKCSYFSTPKNEIQDSLQIKFDAPLKPSFHHFELVTLSTRNYKQNYFAEFLHTIFTKYEAENVLSKYCIGTSKHWIGATVFWQIDNSHKVRHGKVMLYDAEVGKRQKKADGKAYIGSVRSILKLKDFNINQCLFGLHLVGNNKKIALVESEKTAIIMSIFKPEYTWLATGSKSGFKYDMLVPIKEYQIVAFPDKSEFQDWSKKAEVLNSFGFNIRVNDWLESQDQYLDGADFADVYISSLKNVQYTDTEKRVAELTKINPSMKTLIDTFGLVDYFGNEIRVVK